MDSDSRPLRNYILYLLQRTFERKKPPLEWKVEGDKEQIQIWQYQIELEGGERYGPSFNHANEAELFMSKYQSERKAKVITYWTYANKDKYRYVKPETVEYG